MSSTRRERLLPQLRDALAWTAVLLLLGLLPFGAASTTDDWMRLDYAVFPRRHVDEAAVLEWGHSAIISALDASVAWFGPQTSQAALLEVEAQPVLASPVHGVSNTVQEALDALEEQASDVETNEQVANWRKIVLDNADEVQGNVVVMTNTGDLSGPQMAMLAQNSGAAAFLRNNSHHHAALAALIDIPTVMISMNAANVLTTATVDPNASSRRRVVNHGMPDRVRLYAGGDRPFFEDAQAESPAVYLIHNVLTREECKALQTRASTRLQPLEAIASTAGGTRSPLQYTTASSLRGDKSGGPYYVGDVSRVVLWQGLWQSQAAKAVEERIEQVTGFPSTHYSDWIVDRYEAGAYVRPHVDNILAADGTAPIAVLTVFLNDDGGDAAIVYPSVPTNAAAQKPLKIRPQQGLAVVHHVTDDHHRIDTNAVTGVLPASTEHGDAYYLARKYIYATPVSTARRLVLPALSLVAAGGGNLPSLVVRLHVAMLEQFGVPQGNANFDRVCIFVPLLLVLLLVQYVVNRLMNQPSKPPSKSASGTGSSSTSANKKRDKKQN
ncbi:predicted protein [Phaeodactylum tricornutum CCAP 1055/1]|uniref:Prolyl 4-hydroxylase alpha subunit domain-containing protein n=2 Tax=Phaeodactylum tricornutum TaxID=2850 RepID=B7FPI2_PHATC|nr:predicted protein [Phaeodactylum tricornutum CCAP 1055/1]EEC51679.1 predicted protein [Phaeodactylum tricornutum CCAP 1055/1]|eukprot:XP_002177216.1 predicted protein [Phaeodactylum tricornutum CCAP 1055/1]